MEEKVRKDGQIIISYSNGCQQTIDLVGWLYRPWVQIQMPNDQYYSNENFEIDFGVVHFKNTKKMSLYLINPSKVDGKWTITYIKYHQSIKYKF
jgi:ribosomal protein L24E